MTRPSSPATAVPHGKPAWNRPVVAALLLLAAIALAWGNSLRAPFVFDDFPSIVDNASIRRLAPPDWVHPPATAGETVSGRPVLNFSFAIDYACSQLNGRGYRLTQLSIHALAAFLLWGILRRTPGVGGGIALAAALLWAVHPLQTAAVTYLAQRAESLAGMFILLTLYGFVRGAAAGTRGWFAVSVIACLLGVGTKETAVVAPVLVILYDRAFVAGSFKAAWRARGRVHAALFASWLPLAWLVAANRGRGGSAGTGVIGAADYFLTQGGAIMRYLRLTFWPAGPVFDYGTPLVTSLGAAILPLALLGAIGVAMLWLLIRNRPIGFAGAVFFLLLAPSSSFVPIATQTIAEHRMYLALAIPVLLVVSAARCAGPAGIRVAAVGLLALALGGATAARNAVYRSAESLWTDTVAKRPENARAHYNLGLAQREAGRATEAEAQFRRALALQPAHAFAHYELGNLATGRGRREEALAEFSAAVAADPHFIAARVNLGQVLADSGRSAEAIAQWRAALADDPAAPDIQTNLAGTLIQEGEVEEGTALLRAALQRAPDLPEAHYHLGLALAKSGASGAAVAELRRAIALKPAFAPAHRALGNAAAVRGDGIAAEASYREALRVDDHSAETWFALGGLLAREERLGEAARAFETAVALDPNHVRARANLANCQLMAGQVDAAIANYERVLRARPNDADVRRNLELARQMKAR